MWVLDYLSDLESDFSAIHGIDDIYSLPGPRFFRFAYRITAYQGLLSALQQKQQEQTGGGIQVQGDTTYQEVQPDALSLSAGLGEFVEVAEG